MKKNLTLAFLLFFSSLSALFGQNLQTGMRWDYIHVPFLPVHHFSIEITGDTLVQGKTYFKLYSDMFECYFPEPRLIREDGAKVYYRMDGLDHLLYDYSLNPGDTLWQTYPGWDETAQDFVLQTCFMVVGDTMSVWLNGQWRKMQTMEPYASNCTNDIGSEMIDGLGSSFYFFPRYGFCETQTCLRAVYWANGDSAMVNGVIGCFGSSIEETNTALPFTLAPNPARDVLFLEAKTVLSPEAQIFIYDSLGRPIFSGCFADAEKGVLIQHWPSGVYFLEVKDKRKEGVARFVKGPE